MSTPADLFAPEPAPATTLEAFECDVAAVLAGGDFARAEAAIIGAIGEAGGPALHAACDIPADAVEIQGWDALANEFAEADRVFEMRNQGRCGAVSFTLVNSDSSPDLSIERRYFASPAPNAPSWAPHPYSAVPVTIRGLELLMQIQREPTDDPTDAALAGLVILFFYHQAIGELLADPGLTVPAFVQASQQPGGTDYGPEASRTIPAARAAPVEERAAPAEETEEDYHRETAQFVSELREKRAMLRAWPWWRNRARRTIAIGMFDTQSRIMFQNAMGERKAPGWRASDAVFERALERYALYRGTDPQEALRPVPQEELGQLHLGFVAYVGKFGR